MLLCGQWEWPQYEDAFARGLIKNGVSVSRFSSSNFFSGSLGYLQRRVPVPGLALFRLNRELFRRAEHERPDWILCWRSTHILPSTLRRLQELGIRTVSYNNDDPFGRKARTNAPWHYHWIWLWYLKCLPIYQRNFFYRKINRQEALQHGALHAEVLMPYFLPWQDHPVELTLDEQKRFKTEVVFVGHYEPDGRANKIRALLEAGIKVKIWSGGDWPRQDLGYFYDHTQTIEPALGANYAKALCGARICLAFLSKLNRDTYTRRCFEIPACGRTMLAERTEDLKALFKEDEEACFFSSTEELIEKVRWLLAKPELRERIGAAGLRRVWADQHDVQSRAGQFLRSLISEY